MPGHILLRYQLAADYLERRGALRGEHLRLAWEAADAGALLLGGAIGEEPAEALLLFTNADTAAAFARADPYVRDGLVLTWRVEPWHTVVGAGAATPVRA